MEGNPTIFHRTKSIEKKYWEKINIDTINKSSCTKLALSASWTHDLIADGLNWWPDMYIYLPKWPFYIICILYIINIIYIYIYILYIYIYICIIYILYICIYIYIKCQNISTCDFLVIYTFGLMFGSPQLHFR